MTLNLYLYNLDRINIVILSFSLIIAIIHNVIPYIMFSTFYLYVVAKIPHYQKDNAKNPFQENKVLPLYLVYHCSNYTYD